MDKLSLLKVTDEVGGCGFACEVEGCGFVCEWERGEMNVAWSLDWLLIRLRVLLNAADEAGGEMRAADVVGRGIQGVIRDLEEVRDNRRLDELDEGIAPVVRLLRRHGVHTFASCQGGEGHAFASPVVRIWPSNSAAVATEIAGIAKVLSAAGYGGYYLKEIRSYQTGVQPQHDTFIELEFWADADSIHPSENNKEE